LKTTALPVLLVCTAGLLIDQVFGHAGGSGADMVWAGVVVSAMPAQRAPGGGAFFAFDHTGRALYDSTDGWHLDPVPHRPVRSALAPDLVRFREASGCRRA
jgi:hypothetical protein